MTPTDEITDPTWQHIYDRDERILQLEHELSRLRLRIEELEREAKAVRIENSTGLPEFAVKALAEAGMLPGQSKTAAPGPFPGQSTSVMPVGPMIGPGHMVFPNLTVHPVAMPQDRALEKRVSDLEKSVADLKDKMDNCRVLKK